jgi:mono/diheme cytochrome c family protein
MVFLQPNPTHMRKALVLLPLLIFMACGTVKLATPTVDDVALASTDYHGKEVMEVHCGNCHKIYKPRKFSTEHWNGIVPKMVGKANKRAGKTEQAGIDASGEENLLRYILTMTNK